MVFFEESVAGAFSRAGFTVSGGRRLLGLIEVLGMFNVLKQAAESDPELEIGAAVVNLPGIYSIWVITSATFQTEP